MRDIEPRECAGCHASFVPTRRDQVACSATCRQRRKRGTYVITAEDRAAIEKVRALPLPIPRLHPDDVREHVLRSVLRTGDDHDPPGDADVD